MLVHGGFNTEQKKVLNDFAMFDLDLKKWIYCRVFDKDTRIDDKHYAYDTLVEESLGFRQMHTLTAVFDNDYFEDKYGSSKKNRRAMWLYKKPHFKEDEDQRYMNVDEGFYIFGGVD